MISDPSSKGGRKPYNILWICTDQQRFDTIGALNNPYINTPNLDRLCREGTAFTRAYCQNPICTPSRASFMTGMYPSAIRACINGNERFSDAAPLVSKLLRDAGHACGLVGKLHLASVWQGPEKRVDDGYAFFRYSHSPNAKLSQGNQYMQWLIDEGQDVDAILQRKAKPSDTDHGGYRPDIDPKWHQTTWCANEAMRFMEESREGPWLLNVNIFDPHPPFDAPDVYADRYWGKELPGPRFRTSDLEIQKRLSKVDFQSDPKELPEDYAREIIANYYGMVELIDHNVGRMLDKLEELGLAERTLVIFTSDHGETLGDHGLVGKGCRFYESLTRVPLIMRLPGRIQSGVTREALVELIDIAPTVLELAGVALPERMQGRSLWPLLEGRASDGEHRQHARCEFFCTLNMLGTGRPFVPSYGSMIRDDRYKLCVYHGKDYGELYDLENDPWEHENLWESEERREIRERLMKIGFDSLVLSTDLGPKRVGRY